MARDWLQKHPKLLFLLIGLVIGIIPNVMITAGYDQVLDESLKLSDVTITALEKTQDKQRVTIDKLRKENHKLKTKSTTYKVVHPDGTIEERTSDSSESESSISEESKLRFERILESMRETSEARHTETLRRIQSSNKKLHLRAGINTDLNYEVGADYNIWSRFTIGGGMVPQSNQYSLSIGIEL